LVYILNQFHTGNHFCQTVGSDYFENKLYIIVQINVVKEVVSNDEFS